MTFLFWIVLLMMAAGAVTLLLWPLWRGQQTVGVDRRHVNVAIYRERIAELERAVTEGQLPADQAARQRADLDRTLVGDVTDPAPTPMSPPSSRERLVLALLLVALVPALSFGLYLGSSDWRLSIAGGGAEGVEVLLRRLAGKLDNNPDDVAGWLLLARANMKLQRYEEAAEAYAEANSRQVPPSADTLIEEAEARAFAAGGSLQGRPTALVMDALAVAPSHARGLWYRGLVELHAGRNEMAVKYWEQLARQDVPRELRELLDRQIAMAKGEPVPEAAPTQPSQGVRIPLKISLDDSLAAAVSPDTPLFIYARPTDGTRMPLAVVRHRAGDLPLEIALTDEDSMAGRNLSDQDEWLIVARIAKSGSAEARTGDPYAEQTVKRADLSRTISLVIDRTLP